jgi:hypothetical protein
VLYLISYSLHYFEVSIPDIRTLSDVVAVDPVVWVGEMVVGPLKSVFAVRLSEVVATDCVVSVGDTVNGPASCVFAVLCFFSSFRFGRPGQRTDRLGDCAAISTVNMERNVKIENCILGIVR